MMYHNESLLVQLQLINEFDNNNVFPYFKYVNDQLIYDLHTLNENEDYKIISYIKNNRKYIWDSISVITESDSDLKSNISSIIF